MDHDIHVSICEIEMSGEQMEVTLKTFLDDLQIAVGLVPGEELPSDYTSADELIETYISESIQIAADDDQLDLEIKDIASSPEAVWITITARHPIPVKELFITNTFLTEVYNDQTNLINIKYGNQKDSFILNGKKQQAQFNPKS